MQPKLLFLLEGAFWYFGIAKCLFDNLDCEINSIISCDPEQKKFFQNQKLIDFTNVWYYRDHVNVELSQEPNIEYLKNIENDLTINLWNIVYGDRYFYKFNEYYHFSYNQILLILEQQCKFIEEILDKSSPDFFIIHTTDSQFNRLLAEICKSRGITVLMQGPSRFGFRELIYEDCDKMTKILYPVSKHNEKINSKTLQNYFKSHDSSEYFEQYKKRIAKMSSLTSIFERLLKLIFVYSNKKYLTEYNLYGRTLGKLILVKPKLKLRKLYANYFLKKNISNKVNLNVPFIYFPLHVEPERAISFAAPYFTNQIEVITNIAKSLPIGVKLYVKDHPAASIFDPRKASFYKEIIKLQNVTLIPSSFDKDKIFEKCSMVITIAGTSGLEATFFNKPVITFTETLYSKLSHVEVVKNLEDLPLTIKKLWNKNVDTNELLDFVNCIDANSKKINIRSIASSFEIRFRYNILKEKDFLEAINENKKDLKKWVSWYTDEINRIKAIKENQT